MQRVLLGAASPRGHTACSLCLRGTTEHILSCCPKALGKGCYCWCHDQVLKAIADTICRGINYCKRLCPGKKTITFVRVGEKLTAAASTTSSGLLATAPDWELKVDLGKQLKFTETAATTMLRPDFALISESSRQIIILKLIVPWEANKRRRVKMSYWRNAEAMAGK